VAERLYGSLRFAIVCLVAAVAGGMSSIVMQPKINSAGASAVIFGILGALLVAHLRGAEAIPPSVQRSLRNSTLFFALVTLAGGFMFPGIDNAAHVGGLVAGICIGLAFHSPRRMTRFAAPAVLAALVIFSGVTLGKRAGAMSNTEVRYMEALSWYLGRESGVINKWLELQRLARANWIGDDALADRIDKEVAPFWREASRRFAPLEFQPGTDLFEAHQFMLKVSSGRAHALELCISGLHSHDEKECGKCMAEMGQVDSAIGERKQALEGNP
jgi:hypothetical protein